MMEIKPGAGKYTVYASDYMLLDSDVNSGGGTDQTEILQAVLDKALEWGGLVLIMDGAALVSRIIIHSNTTIQCPNAACGFFQKDYTNNSLVENDNLSMTEITTQNVSLLGGTYNFNSPRQERYAIPREQLKNVGCWLGEPGYSIADTLDTHRYFNMGFLFMGIRNLTLRDLRTVNQRIYAICVTCFEHVVMENIHIDLLDNQYGQNQDGIHFYGPGRDISLKNIRGCSGDDFIALAPDELDMVSDITDVTIDGVYLENADQGIRLLSRAKGRLDRVFIRNVYGTYKSFGFFINPWYGTGLGEGEGNFGSIVFENIHMVQTYHKYSEYGHGMLFRIGGRIESLALRGIEVVNPNDTRPIVEVGLYRAHPDDKHSFADIACLTVDGLQVINRSGTKEDADYLTVDGKVDNLIVKNVTADRKGNENSDTVIRLKEGAEIQNLVVSQVLATGIGDIIKNEGGIINHTYTDSVYCPSK